MRLLLSFLWIIFQLQLCKADPLSYMIDPNNPSFLLYGNELTDQTIVLVSADNSSRLVQVNALFEDFNNTQFLIVGSGGASYTQSDLQRQGSKGLRLYGPITLTFQPKTSMAFYMTFALYPYQDDWENNQFYLGYDRYIIDVYNGQPNKSQSYSLPLSKESGTMLTIINKGYSKESCHPFDIINIDMDDGCSLRIHVGAGPFDRSGIYMIADYRGSRNNQNGWALPTLSAAYYTFTVPQYCGAKFELVEHEAGTRQIAYSSPDSGYWISGTIVSCDFPGRNYSRKEPVNPIQQRYHVIGPSAAPIHAWPAESGTPGINGYLSLEIFEDDQRVAYSNRTSSIGNGWLEATGHDLLVTWVPGEKQTGLFLRFYYDSPITIYMDIRKNPLVFHTAYWELTQSGFEIQAAGSFIHVNAMQLTQTRALYFWDQTQNYSLPQIIEKPRLFKDFVHMSAVDSWYDRFIATFTRVDVNDTAKINAMGLSDYRFWFSNGFYIEQPTVMKFDSKNHTQALTVVAPRGGAVISNILMSSACEVPLYVSGIPSEAEKQKMLIYTFSQERAVSFAPSHIISPAATFIVPSMCQFSFTLHSNNDPFERELFDGSNGFIYSQEYPGNYDNYYSIYSPDDTTDYLLSQSKAFGSVNANFSIDVISADPGVNGSLSFIFGKTGKPQETINIQSFVTNQTIQSDGTMVEIEWNGTNSQSGFLLKYQMKKQDLTPTTTVIPTTTAKTTPVTTTTTKTTIPTSATTTKSLQTSKADDAITSRTDSTTTSTTTRNEHILSIFVLYLLKTLLF